MCQAFTTSNQINRLVYRIPKGKVFFFFFFSTKDFVIKLPRRFGQKVPAKGSGGGELGSQTNLEDIKKLARSEAYFTPSPSPPWE